MDAVLSVNGCSFSYGEGRFCLRDISVAVRSGEFVGLVGPNGSGKSTLLRVMAGILRPPQGDVLVGGRPVSSYRRLELARQVAFLPQSPTASFEMTVREVVALGRYPYLGPLGLLTESDSRVIRQALSDVESGPLADRHFSTLSEGEKQRVLLASILAQEPRVMLLDEPAAALDIHHKSHMFDLLWLLSRKGIGVVVVTHDLNSASEFCDTLALLQGGRIMEVGPPSQVMREDLLAETYQTPLRVVDHPVTSSRMVLVLGRRLHGNGEARTDRP